MLSYRTDAICNAIAAVVLIAQSGCATVCKHHQPPAMVSTVSTGGTYAVSKTVSIPAAGITLGEVVNSTLRTGVRDLSTKSTNSPGNAAVGTGPIQGASFSRPDVNIDQVIEKLITHQRSFPSLPPRQL